MTNWYASGRSAAPFNDNDQLACHAVLIECFGSNSILYRFVFFFISPSVFYEKSLRYQRGNQNPYIEEEQTTQRSKEKVQNDKQRSTKHTHKTKDRVTRTPLKTGGEPGAPEG